MAFKLGRQAWEKMDLRLYRLQKRAWGLVLCVMRFNGIVLSRGIKLSHLNFERFFPALLWRKARERVEPGQSMRMLWERSRLKKMVG